MQDPVSDRYGRRTVLLLSMLGNIASNAVWLFARTFDVGVFAPWQVSSDTRGQTFLLSRLIGGLSEGNVQLSIAILSDISSPEARGKALAVSALLRLLTLASLIRSHSARWLGFLAVLYVGSNHGGLCV